MPITNILPGMGKTSGVMSPLIPFNMIVETDVGLLSLVFKDYLDPRVFNQDFFVGKKVNQLVYDLYNREKENPLSLCIRDEYTNSCDTFYNQFMEREYDKILNKSVVTEFYRLIRAYNAEPEIKVTVVCEKQQEIDLLKQYENTKNCNIVLSSSMTPSNIKSHNQFFFKSIADAVPYVKHLKDKSIYIANYRFNKTEEGEFINHPIIPILAMNNVINIIDVFNVDKLKRNKEEN